MIGLRSTLVAAPTGEFAAGVFRFFHLVELGPSLWLDVWTFCFAPTGGCFSKKDFVSYLRTREDFPTANPAAVIFPLKRQLIRTFNNVLDPNISKRLLIQTVDVPDPLSAPGEKNK